MAYTANTPTANQLVSQTQSLIYNNFQALAPWGNGYGIFPVQVSAPTVGAAEIGIYQNSNNQLVLQKGAGTPIHFSDYSTSSTSGWAYLPSGLLMKWGETGSLALGANSFTMPTSASIPVFSVCNFAMITPTTANSPVDPNTAAYVYNVGPTSFGIYVTARTSGSTSNRVFKWFAIGN